ncbi:MAG: alpha/beta fold hydrolase [Acidimicrobiales bacterium]
MAQVLLNDQPRWARLPSKGGPTVLFLHGGLSSSASLLRTMGPRLSPKFQLAAFDRRGHGRSPDDERPFSYFDMADEAITFIELLKRRVHLFGHSDGANVAIEVLMRRPELVERAVLVGGNFHYDGLVSMPDFTPDSAGFSEFAASFARRSPDGVAHAAVVVEKSLALVTTQPDLSASQLTGITNPVLLLVGDDDVVKLSHTLEMYEALAQGQLAVIPGASHSVLKEKPKICARLVLDFLLGPIPPHSEVPIRRALSGS